jgi:hypothetical protein
MNFVEPIRDRKKIAQIKNQLRGQRRYRDLLLFNICFPGRFSQKPVLFQQPINDTTCDIGTRLRLLR